MSDRRSQILSVLSSPSSLIPIPIPLASSSEDISQNIMEEPWEHWPLHSVKILAIHIINHTNK